MAHTMGFLAPLLGALASLAAAAPAQQGPEDARGSLFDAVVDVLGDRFVDRDFRRATLPELALRFRPAAVAATSAAEERGVVHALLAAVPASHLALLSRHTHQNLEDELMGRRTPTLGCTLLQLGGRFWLDAVLEGGPAAAAGLRAGDEVLAIEGAAPGGSALLDWRSDDAHLDDPPTHGLVVQDRQVVTLRIAASDGARDVALTAAPWSALAASIEGVRPITAAGHRLLYVHLWFVFHGRSGRLVEAALEDHGDCSGLLLDLRGRGGSALECAAVVRAVEHAADLGMPTVALVDARTRSAKEVIASDLQRRGLAPIVGERTAGAVLPATFVELARDAVLMLPETSLGASSRRLEGKGVEPDVAVSAPLPAFPGDDPILAAGIAALAQRIH